MNILVTNDDGIDYPGIYALVKALKNIGNVYVVAPNSQQSAVGHALTVSNPLRANKFYRDGELFGYAVNGTPSDCVKLAICSLLDVKPDILVSGINHGQNTSINIIYSGTVSAATEGMLLGIPSIAVSLAAFNYNADCGPAAEIARKLVSDLYGKTLPKGTLLNVNIPALPTEKIKGMKVTSLSQSYWEDNYEHRVDPLGHDYYWFNGKYVVPDSLMDTDDLAIKSGYVSITPIRFNFTHTDYIEELKKVLSK